jgi:hypothetical protein
MWPQAERRRAGGYVATLDPSPVRAELAGLR